MDIIGETQRKRETALFAISPFCMTTVDAVATGSQVFDAVFEKTLNFRIEMEYDSARQFIERIGQYNEFDPDCVLSALDQIDDLIPRLNYGGVNPNNGTRKYKIEVGR